MRPGKSFGTSLLLALLSSACGGETNSDALAKCENLSDILCGKAIDCRVSAGRLSADDRAAEYQQCRSALTPDLPCSRAVAVGDRYDSCAAELSSWDCAALIPPLQDAGGVKVPASCEGVIEVSR